MSVHFDNDRFGTGTIIVLAALVNMTLFGPAAASDVTLPVRKDTIIQSMNTTGEASTRTPVVASEQSRPMPPAPAANAHRDADKDPAQTRVPGVRRMKPTVPPKPAALQRWLSRL